MSNISLQGYSAKNISIYCLKKAQKVLHIEWYQTLSSLIQHSTLEVSREEGSLELKSSLLVGEFHTLKRIGHALTSLNNILLTVYTEFDESMRFTLRWCAEVVDVQKGLELSQFNLVVRELRTVTVVKI